VDISKFKFELYDILAVLLPGFILLCSVWILLRGWPAFISSLLTLSGTGFTAMLLIAFSVGHIIQELGDAGIKGFRGERYFKAGRDDFWMREEGKTTKRLVARDLGFEPSVDTAFDFCLSKIKGDFPKRDSFVATSDFCRSLFAVGILAIPSLIRVVRDAGGSCQRQALYYGLSAFTLALFLYLSHRRMVRFREYSETPVFRIFLATSSTASADTNVVKTSGSEGE
jgi:hypothetical protein